MKIGLIPPIPDLWRMKETGLHLILSHLLHNPEYLAFYQYRREQGDYLILDNGAHELGASEGHANLLEKARRVGAQEVVLPDVLFDRRGTTERTKRMLKWVVSPEGWESYCQVGKPRFMFVPQGHERSDWAMCLTNLFNYWHVYSEKAPEPLESPVVGISKDYDTWRGGLSYLIGHYVEPLKEKEEFDVHCLGWPSDLWSIAKVSRAFPWIRSTDSAKPFVYAKNRILLEPGGKFPKYPRRDPNYFTEQLGKEEWEIAQRNVLVYEAAAMDELILSA